MVDGINTGKNEITKFLAYPPGAVPSDLIFKYWSFSRNFTDARSVDHNKMPSDTQIRIKCNDTIKTIMPTFDEEGTINSAMYQAMAKFEGGPAPAGTYCKVIVSSDSLDIEWRYTIRSVKCVNGKAEYWKNLI